MRVVASEPTAEPHARRWSLAEYEQLLDQGWFQDQRVELIDGEIVEMSPQKELHASAILLVDRALRPYFGDEYSIRIQMPLMLELRSRPEPDWAVVRGGPRDFKAPPTSALLVVEISDTTLRYDRETKASLYASGGIPELWVPDLRGQKLEVFRSPLADSARPLGGRYTESFTVVPGGRVSPLAAPSATIEVSDLLP